MGRILFEESRLTNKYVDFIPPCFSFLYLKACSRFQDLSQLISFNQLSIEYCDREGCCEEYGVDAYRIAHGEYGESEEWYEHYVRDIVLIHRTDNQKSCLFVHDNAILKTYVPLIPLGFQKQADGWYRLFNRKAEAVKCLDSISEASYSVFLNPTHSC
jgi:hypothetical protein